MLSGSLTAHAAGFRPHHSLENSPHAEWRRKHWEQNLESIQFWIHVRTRSSHAPTVGGEPNRVVLVVDDEIAIAITLSQILIRHGFPTIWLTDPGSAVALFERLPLSLLITDIDMPGIDGVTLAALARQNHENCPVLLFSAKGAACQTAERLCACDDGVHIQTKPVGVTALLNRVSILCTSRPDVQPATRLDRAQELQDSVSNALTRS